MRMGEFFSWEEMTYSRRAVEKGLDNRPGAEARKALEHLVLHLLDPLRRLYGKPIAVTSGYRCEEVNRLVGFASVGVGIRPGHSLPETEFPASFVEAERGESDAGVGAVGGIVLFIEQLRHEAAKHPTGTDGTDGYGGLGDAEREMGGPAYSTGRCDSHPFAAGRLLRSG